MDQQQAFQRGRKKKKWNGKARVEEAGEAAEGRRWDGGVIGAEERRKSEDRGWSGWMAKGQIGLGFSTAERQGKRNEGGLRRAGKEKRRRGKRCQTSWVGGLHKSKKRKKKQKNFTFDKRLQNGLFSNSLFSWINQEYITKGQSFSSWLFSFPHLRLNNVCFFRSHLRYA